MKTPEGELKAYLQRRAKGLGMQLRKVAYEGRVGAPDWLAMCPNGFGFLELKAPDGRVSPMQAREHAALRSSGIKVFVCRTPFDVDEALDEIDGGAIND